MREIFTIGHSNHKIDFFIDILKNHQIEVIVDVRSMPYSKYADWFNKESLEYELKKNNIFYIPMGEYLGARWEDRNLIFPDGKVNFELVQQTEKFKEGILRLEKGLKKGYKISLMCSEKEAFDCHRFVLVSNYLHKLGYKVFHIYPNEVKSQNELVQKLLTKYQKKIPQNNLFQKITIEEQIKIAFQLRNKDIAYNVFTNEGDEE